MQRPVLCCRNFAHRAAINPICSVIDEVNARYGRGSHRLALEPPVVQWTMKRAYLSAGLTNDFNQLKSVRC